MVLNEKHVQFGIGTIGLEMNGNDVFSTKRTVHYIYIYIHIYIYSIYVTHITAY